MLSIHAFPVGLGPHVLPCNNTHSFSMQLVSLCSWPLGVALLDKYEKTFHMPHAFLSSRPGPFATGAHSALELLAGTLHFPWAHTGDCLAFETG